MTKMNFATIKEAAQFLDAEEPGWHDRINLNDFDMASGHSCVLGQLFKSDLDATNKFYKSMNDNQRYLFGWRVDVHGRMPDCTKLWRLEIIARTCTPTKSREEELEEAIAKMQAELKELKDPEVTVTLRKSQWESLRMNIELAGGNVAEINKAAGYKK